MTDPGSGEVPDMAEPKGMDERASCIAPIDPKDKRDLSPAGAVAHAKGAFAVISGNDNAETAASSPVTANVSNLLDDFGPDVGSIVVDEPVWKGICDAYPGIYTPPLRNLPALSTHFQYGKTSTTNSLQDGYRKRTMGEYTWG